MIKKPTKIHSRARAREAAEAKAKGRHSGYGRLRLTQRFRCTLGVTGSALHAHARRQLLLASGCVTMSRARLNREEGGLTRECTLRMEGLSGSMSGACDHPRRQAEGNPRGAVAHQDPVDPPHARAAPAAAQVPRLQEDRQAPLPRAVPQGASAPGASVAVLAAMRPSKNTQQDGCSGPCLRVACLACGRGIRIRLQWPAVRACSRTLCAAAETRQGP